MDPAEINRKAEVRFLEIDKIKLMEKLDFLGAEDCGEDLLKEIIFYDSEKKWLEEKKIVRIRDQKNTHLLTYKHNVEDGKANSIKELEFGITDPETVKKFLEEIGLKAFRYQEKKRPTFLLGDVAVDINKLPEIPPYVEIEGPSEEHIKKAALALGFDWNKAHLESSRDIVEKIYKIPLTKLKYFTFEKVE